MKRIYLLVFALVTYVGSISLSSAQPIVNIPDAAFKSSLVANSGINTNLDGNIDSAEAASFTGSILAQGLGISDLTGIEAFTSVTSINFSSNPAITTVDLSANTALSTLYCWNCNLTGLDFSGNPNLYDLNCAGNDISSLDLSPCPIIAYVFCQTNVISAISISTNTSLTYFDISSNPIGNLDVSNNTSLVNYYCSNAGMNSIDLSSNPSIQLLDCSINSLTSLDISNLSSLSNLNCAYNQLTDLDLSTSWNLVNLQCHNNQLTSLNTFSCSNLATIYCGENLLTCLNLGYNGFLTDVSAFNSPNLIKVNLKNFANPAITMINFNNCPVLGCVQVDDSTYSETNWNADFGPSAYFTEDCGQPSASFTHNGPVCSGTPIVFDQTMSNVDWFMWSFGDGDTSTLVDPSHLYTTGGLFNVTLTAKNCYGSTTPFDDIQMGNDIFGAVNSTSGPLSDGNIVLLKYEPFYTSFDTVDIAIFEVPGGYYFGSVLDGDYMIKVYPDTIVNPNLIPTYSGDASIWESATIINHGCFSMDSIDIFMAELVSAPSGPGSFSGEVVEGIGFGRAPGDPVHGVDIKLGVTSTPNIMACTTTDTMGQYSLVNIPYGTYTIYVEIAGLLKDSSYTLTIDSNQSTFTYLDYIVDSNSIYIIGNIGVEEVENEIQGSFNVYPNPVKDEAMIRYTIEHESDITLDVYNVHGIKLQTLLTTHVVGGEYMMTFNPETSGLKSGVYFIRYTVNGKSQTKQIVILD